jgi:hypothetical protein
MTLKALENLYLTNNLISKAEKIICLFELTGIARFIFIFVLA